MIICEIQKQELQKKSDDRNEKNKKMGRGENVTADVLLRICEALDCIMERVPDEPPKRSIGEFAEK